MSPKEQVTLFASLLAFLWAILAMALLDWSLLSAIGSVMWLYILAEKAKLRLLAEAVHRDIGEVLAMKRRERSFYNNVQ